MRYYTSVDNRPGPLLATFSQQAGTLSVTGPEPTGLNLVDNPDYPEYEYSATHAPLPVNAGGCYWIEIVNELSPCVWYWERGEAGNYRAFQDGALNEQVDGYDAVETITDDLAVCLGMPLGDASACSPPVPPNDNCADAMPLSGDGEVFFDIATATEDGPADGQCNFFSNMQMSHDVWYCWSAPCTGTAVLRTCDESTINTKIAVYDACSCPPTLSNLLACSDDACGPRGRQSMLIFEMTQGESYLLRLGTSSNIPGGAGILHFSCGPPDNPACPGTGSCCDAQADPGCADEQCCELVCACDPFCCAIEWDDLCASDGYGSGCGADIFCDCGTCGSPKAGDCCTYHSGIACKDSECCQTVCDVDDFCCSILWDGSCAQTAREFCPLLCGTGCTSDAECADSVACTADSCNVATGFCSNTLDDSVCQDSSFCNGEETCFANGCQPGQPRTCDDEIDCTLDSCDEANAACVHQPRPWRCDDGIACTLDSCTPSGCAHNATSCGACCFSDHTCADQLAEDECTAAGGGFIGTGSACSGDSSGDGIDDSCGLVPIPTVSEWGLLALALCLLIAGKLFRPGLFRPHARQQRAFAPSPLKT